MTSITTTCRDISELLPAAQTACRLGSKSVLKQVLRTSLLLKHIARRNDRSTFMHKAEQDQGRLSLGHWIVTISHD